MRILLVVHAFPPLNTVGAHRSYGWARTWATLGHEVHVLTTVKGLLDGSLDMQRDMTGIHVHEVPYLLVRKRAAAIPDSIAKAERWERLKTLTRRLRLSMAMFGDPRLLACRPMLGRGVEISRSLNWDFIIASSPPEVNFLVARALSRRTGAPWVADFRDLWFRDMRLYQTRLASVLSGPVNRWTVRNAAVLVTVSRGLQQRLARYLGREVLVSYNGFFASAEGAASQSPPRQASRLHIVYTGRMYPGKRDPEPLFRTLSRLSDSNPKLAHALCVDFYGYDEPWLRALVDRHGVQDCVRIHGFVPHRESMALQRSADVLLFLDWTDPGAEGVLTGKLFEYIGSGRPILSIGRHADTEAAQLIAETQCGVTLTSDEDIIAYLLELLRQGRPADVDRQHTARYAREKQARELLHDLQQALAATGEP